MGRSALFFSGRRSSWRPKSYETYPAAPVQQGDGEFSTFRSFSLSLQCDTAWGTKAFFDVVHHPPEKLALFGAACTEVTDPIAKASKFWKLIQVRG